MGPAAFAADRFHTPGANALRLRPRPTDAETYCRRREELLAGSPHMGAGKTGAKSIDEYIKGKK